MHGGAGGGADENDELLALKHHLEGQGVDLNELTKQVVAGHGEAVPVGPSDPTGINGITGINGAGGASGASAQSSPVGGTGFAANAQDGGGGGGEEAGVGGVAASMGAIREAIAAASVAGGGAHAGGTGTGITSGAGGNLWQPQLDAEGRLYYWHTGTREVSWTVPFEDGGQGGGRDPQEATVPRVRSMSQELAEAATEDAVQGMGAAQDAMLAEREAAERRVELRKVFGVLDTNGNGTLERSEMLRGIRDSPEVRSVLRESPALRLLLQPRFWRDAFDYMDTGNTGEITFPEFERTVTAGNEESIRRAALRRVFDLLDTNGNGTLEKAELLRGIRDSDSVRRVLRANPALHRLLVPRIWKKSFNAMDTKGRAGEVSFDEFELFVGGGGEHTALRECFHVLGGSDVKSVPISRAMKMLGGVGGGAAGAAEVLSVEAAVGGR